MIRTVLVSAALALSACASTAPAYAPAASAGRAGYSETQIEANRYFVTYRADGGADAALVQDFALLRAAELTLAAGRDWFWVDRRTFDAPAARGYGPSIGVGVGAGSWGGHTSTSVGVSASFPVGGGQSGRARAATLEIRLGEGVKPDDANAYDAHAIVANIRARRAP
jgi:hypothetical protein